MNTAADFDLAKYIRPGDTLTYGQADSQPVTLLRALAAQRHRIGGRVRIFLGIGQNLQDVFTPECTDVFDYLAYCGSGSNLALTRAGVLDIVVENYSQLPALLSEGALRTDVVMLQVSPPDEQGRYSLGMSREYVVPAMKNARVILAEVSRNVPWTYGGPYLTKNDISLLIDSQEDDGTLLSGPSQPGAVEQAIGRHVASVVPDGATLQTGIGTMPDAILAALTQHKDLGLHSGSLGECVVDLAESGALTNRLKTVDTGKIIGGILMGGSRLRKFAHLNPQLELRSTEYTHDAQVLASQHRFTAINSAVEVDLTGQINCETAAGAYRGAVGGIVDFLRGAVASKGGTPIIALPSMARSNSRIVAALSGPVSIPRSCSCVIVTEHGVADLRGLTLSQRIDRMISIADPSQRDELERQISAQTPLGWKQR